MTRPMHPDDARLTLIELEERRRLLIELAERRSDINRAEPGGKARSLRILCVPGVDRYVSV